MINWQGLSSRIEREQRNNPQVLARCKYALGMAAEALQILSGHGYDQFHYGATGNAEQIPSAGPTDEGGSSQPQLCEKGGRSPESWEGVLRGRSAEEGLGELVPPSLKAEFASQGQEVVAASADQSLQGSPRGVSENG